MPVVLPPFHTFSQEAAILGRILVGYSNIEIDLMNCVQVAGGGNLNTVLKSMFSKRSETWRINQADKLGAPHYAAHGLIKNFQHALAIMRRCLEVRNQYAHWALWDDNTGKLAFANIESLAKLKRPVNNLIKLRTFHVDVGLLAEQEAYFVYADRYTSWLGLEIRTRKGTIQRNPLPKPKRVKKPRLKLK